MSGVNVTGVDKVMLIMVAERICMFIGDFMDGMWIYARVIVFAFLSFSRP